MLSYRDKAHGKKAVNDFLGFFHPKPTIKFKYLTANKIVFGGNIGSFYAIELWYTIANLETSRSQLNIQIPW